ncbi:NAD(P)-binding domain-containing protein [Methylobacter sp.]|uniref:NAD(P)-binding domain-containing protein n=1 Tax=Methylobacter sp. TaxID=2051955 RepID=UPI002FDEF388
MKNFVYRVAIVGGGPAGLSAAIRAAETGLSHILLEAESHLSNTIHRFQKGKYVMAEPVRLPLRSSLAFEAGSRESILEAWSSEAARLEVNVRRNSPVTSIDKDAENFSVKLADGDIICAETVILAFGLQGQPNKLNIEGETLGFVDYHLDDPDEFDDQAIVVVGAGDSALETALDLAEHNRVILINRRDDFYRAAAGNRNAILEAIADGRIECFYNSVPRLIEAQDDRARLEIDTSGEMAEIICDKIIARLGASHPRAFLESCGIVFSDEEATALPVLDSRYQSTVKNLYVIGSLAGYPLIKQALNQGFEVIEQIRGKPVQPVEDQLLLDKLIGMPGADTVETALIKISGTIPLFDSTGARPLRELLLESLVLYPDPGATVFRESDYSDSFYSILSGEIFIHLPEENPDLIIRLEAGEFFGDSELISGRRRTVTAVAGENCILIETPRLAIKKLGATHRTVADILEKTGVERAIRWYLAPGLPDDECKTLERSVSCHCFETGTNLFQAGDAGNSVHFIRSGAVTVTRTVDGHEVPYRLVTAGDYVGGWDALADSVRRATACATAETSTVEIPGDDFRWLLERHPELRRNLHANFLAYHADNTEAIQQNGEIISFLMEQGVGEGTDVLLIDESICTRCDNCEKACADTHGGISRLNREAGPTFASIHLPTSCRHCVQPHCMTECPPNAIHRAANGEVFIDDTCIGCGNCVQNCPYDVIHLASDQPENKPGLWARLLFGFDETAFGDNGAGGGHKKAVKCDMCKDLSGGPACVSACPTGAAFRGDPEHTLFNTLKRSGKQLQEES